MRKEIKWTDLVDPEKLTIEMMWGIFSKLVISKQAPDIQNREMKKAFYAGFIECFKIMTDISTELSEDNACLVLDKIQTEADEFIQKILDK